MKAVDKLRTKRAYLVGEVNALRACAGHPHIVALHAVYESPAFCFLVMELMAGE